MKQVTYGVRELQSHLGDALRAVRRGERVLITSHRRVVAVLLREDDELPGEDPVERKLRRMAAEGKIRLGKRGRIPPFKAFALGGVSDQVLADRR